MVFPPKKAEADGRKQRVPEHGHGPAVWVTESCRSGCVLARVSVRGKMPGMAGESARPSPWHRRKECSPSTESMHSRFQSSWRRPNPERTLGFPLNGSTRGCLKARGRAETKSRRGCRWDRARGGGRPTSPVLRRSCPLHFQLTDCNRFLAPIKRLRGKLAVFFFPAGLASQMRPLRWGRKLALPA